MKENSNDKKYLLQNVNLNQIYVFFKAYENNNFSKAARDMFMTQATVSRIISNLEKEMEFPLFYRSPTGVAPTPAAEVLYKEWKEACAVLEESYKKAAFRAQEGYKKLRIGDLESLQKQEYLVPILNEFEKRYPEVDLIIDEKDMLECTEGLLSGNYDLVFLSTADAPSEKAPHISSETIIESPMGISIYKNHPLYEKKNVTVQDLERQTYIMPDPEVRSVFNDMVNQFCEEYGFQIRYRYIYEDFDKGFLRFLMGKGLMFSNRNFDSRYSQDIRRLEMASVSLGIKISWLNTNPNPYVRHFIECTRKVKQEIDTEVTPVNEAAE